MSLTKSQRDALPETDFAVPGKRALPMHDAKHVRMAWDMVSRTKDLSETERAEARKRILSKARDLGIDASDWGTIKAMAFEAMALDVPHVEDHPNRMPFEGVLTRIDEPSDEPPGGSGGRRVLLPKAVAEKALPSLLGMAVDFTETFSGHDAQKKIGIITEAWIDGNAVHVKGFVYAADFPDTAARIRADKDVLGFSFEMKNVRVADPGADPLEIEDCVFTGAAILRKDKAAYQTTSLAAHADETEIAMTKEELQEILAAALKPVNDEISALKAGQDKVAADLQAGKETHAKIKPHADALRAAADAMCAAGVGGHATKGPSAHLTRMADRMEADAMVGKLPHIYRDHDYFVDASADGKPEESAETKALKDKVATLETLVTDLKAQAFKTAEQPARKSAAPAEAQALLSKYGLQAGADGKVSVAAVDQTLEAAGVKGAKAIEAKLKLREAGVLG